VRGGQHGEAARTPKPTGGGRTEHAREQWPPGRSRRRARRTCQVCRVRVAVRIWARNAKSRGIWPGRRKTRADDGAQVGSRSSPPRPGRLTGRTRPGRLRRLRQRAHDERDEHQARRERDGESRRGWPREAWTMRGTANAPAMRASTSRADDAEEALGLPDVVEPGRHRPVLEVGQDRARAVPDESRKISQAAALRPRPTRSAARSRAGTEGAVMRRGRGRVVQLRVHDARAC